MHVQQLTYLEVTYLLFSATRKLYRNFVGYQTRTTEQ
jgi:hypothetical protein